MNEKLTEKEIYEIKLEQAKEEQEKKKKEKEVNYNLFKKAGSEIFLNLP